MSYSPPSPSSVDENQSPPDPRYVEWDRRSRTKLQERLYEAVDRRSDAVQELVSRDIQQWISKAGLNDIRCADMEWNIDPIMMEGIHKEIAQQIAKWKGLRWWKFNDEVHSWSKWFKKAKCWQDQNQHKPLGHFWCFILDELKNYTLRVSHGVFPMDESKEQVLQRCLYIICVLSVFTGSVRFERTRETPLLPVRTLTQSKELQTKLKSVDSGFTLSLWKQQAEREHKRQKQDTRDGDKSQRGNIATLLNAKCCKHAKKVYRRCYEELKEMISSLNDMNDTQEEDPDESVFSAPNIMIHDSEVIPPANGYHSTRGHSSHVSQCESQRFSPMTASDMTARRPRALYRDDGSSERALAQLTVENYYLRNEIKRMKTRLWDEMMKRYPVYNVPTFTPRIPSPMRVPVPNDIISNAAPYDPYAPPPNVSTNWSPDMDTNCLNHNPQPQPQPPGIYTMSPIPYAYRESFG